MKRKPNPFIPPFNGRMPDIIPANSTLIGATRLAKRIEAIWLKHGQEVMARPFLIQKEYYGVKSDLINGLPKSWWSLK